MTNEKNDTVISIQKHIEQSDRRDINRQAVFTKILDSFKRGNVRNIFETITKSACQYLSFNRAALLEDTEKGEAGIVVYEWCDDVDGRYFQTGYTVPYHGNYCSVNQQLEKMDTCFLTMSADSPFAGTPTEDTLSVVVTVWLNSQRYGLFILDERKEMGPWANDAIWFLFCIQSVLSIAAAQNDSLIMSNKYTEQLYYMVYYDQLTHLPNRYRFDENATRAIIEAQKDNQQGFVLYIDLDDFQIINDSYGHKVGDMFLVEFSRFLQDELNSRDSVFRLGGDEFAVLVKPARANEIEKVIQIISERAHLPWQVGEYHFYSTVSLAVIQYPRYGETAEDVLKNADIALNIAKQSGRNCCVFYNQDLHQDPLRRIELEREMRDAIGNGFRGFETHFQPIVETADGRIRSAEALARWRDRTGKPVPPNDFIPLAEYLGLIIPIGEFMLAKAACLCKKINDMGLEDFDIGVNVSMQQIRQPDFTKRVREILDEAEVNYSNIVLEVTESIAAPDMGRLSAVFQELRSFGIKIALDDFGTGYSSLSYLQQMPIDIIKIDRSFVHNIVTDDYAHTFVHIIAELGNALGRRVCIEGVETQEQLELCKNTGADCIQGYYFYSARTASELMDICQKELAKLHIKTQS